jgi:hypothetical protein
MEERAFCHRRQNGPWFHQLHLYTKSSNKYIIVPFFQEIMTLACCSHPHPTATSNRHISAISTISQQER